jgi:HEAT repeat protein
MFARLVPIALIALFALGCEKPTHENIEKWAATKKGPAKLKSALLDDGLDADLSAHAAAVMIRTGRDNEVKTELEHMNPSRRSAVVGKLAPRLWTIARIEGEMLRPAPSQTQAKDALVIIRKYADPAARTQIDGYLIDWYAVPSYEGRANAGAFPGATVLRMLGPAAAKKMMAVINSIIASPGQETTKKRITDELMLGVAVTGDPEAVKYILDIARMDRGDPTLPTRAMGALYRAYVNSEGLFDVVDPAALKPNVDALAKIARDDRMPGPAANAAVALIRSVGPPDCLPPLLAMIPHPHADSAFRYLGPDHALKCGGVKAIKDVVRAMPDIDYEQQSLAGSVVLGLSKLEPRDQVLVELRDLLGDKSRVARWVAIETLAAMKSVEDAPKIASVTGGGDKLGGYWGNVSGKPEPTLGQRAKELAAQLSKASK